MVHDAAISCMNMP